MRKLMLCLPLLVFGLMVYAPVIDARAKKAKPPTPEEFTEAFFATYHIRPKEHESVSPGNISMVQSRIKGGRTFGVRRLRGRCTLPWPIFCAADADGDMELTRKELTAYMKLEDKGKAPSPTAADYAYEARVDGIKAFWQGLKNDADKDGKLSMNELGLGEDAADGFAAADLNGDDALDIKEFPGWFAVGIHEPENDPLRLYHFEGSKWTYDFNGARSEEWEIIDVTDNSSLIQVTTLEDGKRSERVPAMFLRLWFASGRKAWCLPGSGWEVKADGDELDLPIGKVKAKRYEATEYSKTYTEYYCDEYPGIPVKFMDEHYGQNSTTVGTLTSISLKQPRHKKKRKEGDDNGVSDGAAKLAGVSVFLALDKDNDGRITAREYLDGTKAYRDERCKGKVEGVRALMEAWISPHHFVFADKDGTEGLSREEFDEYRKRFERRGSYPSPRSITRAQLERLCAIQAEDELDRYDANRDGAITDDDPIAGKNISAYVHFYRADLDADGSITKGELEEHHRARVLARAPDLAAAKESDSGVHDWKLEDKNLDFALFQKVGRSWTIELTFADGKQEANGRIESRVLRADDEGAIILTRVYGPSGKLLVAAKLPISFTPEFEALLKPAPNSESQGEKTAKAAGKRWKCNVYTVKLKKGIEGEEWISQEYPGLRVKSSAQKNGRKVEMNLAKFND